MLPDGKEPPSRVDRNSRGTVFERVTIAESAFTDVNLAGSVFRDVSLAKAVFDDVNLSAVTVRDATLRGAQFRECDFGEVEIFDSRLAGMRIDGIPVTELLAVYRQARAGGAAEMPVEVVDGRIRPRT